MFYEKKINQKKISFVAYKRNLSNNQRQHQQQQKKLGFDWRSLNLLVAIEQQSVEIANGVHINRDEEDIGAGDQVHKLKQQPKHNHTHTYLLRAHIYKNRKPNTLLKQKQTKLLLKKGIFKYTTHDFE